MPKNAYFWNNNAKIASGLGALAPNSHLPPAAEGSAPRPSRHYFYLIFIVKSVEFISIA